MGLSKKLKALTTLVAVVAGLVPAINVLGARQTVDAGIKPV